MLPFCYCTVITSLLVIYYVLLHHSLLRTVTFLLLHCYNIIITYYCIIIITYDYIFLLLDCYHILLHHSWFHIITFFVITLLLHHYYVLLHNQCYLLLRYNYYILSRHYSTWGKQAIMSSLLRFMHFPCFHYYIIIADNYHYYPLLHVTNRATCRWTSNIYLDENKKFNSSAFDFHSDCHWLVHASPNIFVLQLRTLQSIIWAGILETGGHHSPTILSRWLSLLKFWSKRRLQDICRPSLIFNKLIATLHGCHGILMKKTS